MRHHRVGFSVEFRRVVSLDQYCLYFLSMIFAGWLIIFSEVICRCRNLHSSNSLELVASWADHQQLELSPNKCSIMHLSTKRAATDALTLKVGEFSLPITTQCSDLELSYYEQLRFTSHVSRFN